VPKLLLADDSVTIQRVVDLTFSGEDVEVVAVGDGEQAIARIPIERPDIVLADIGMPKRTGYEVAAFVKTHPEFKHVPVLLLAGAFEPVDEQKAREAGCDGVLVKPFEPQHVVSRVRELLDRVQGGRGSAGARVDEYLDGLDTAFAKRGSTPPAGATDDADEGQGVPTLDQVLASTPAVPPIDLPVTQPPVALTPRPTPIATPPIEPPEAPSTLAPAAGAPGVASHPTRADHHRTVIAEAFSALLALEEGDPAAKPIRLTTTDQAPLITDAVVDEVARRVLQRLAPDTARAIVTEVVSEIAERLVREEIARIRSRQ
jgi:CheY-like chemotaxis protein/histone H3/H4